MPMWIAPPSTRSWKRAASFAAEVIQPLNVSGDTEGCTLDKSTHEVTRPRATRKPTSSTSKAAGRAEAAIPSLVARACATINGCFYEMLNAANQAWTMYPA